MSNAKATRIYICKFGDETRLVRAQNRVQALNHVARTKIDVDIASQDDLIAAVTQGVTVETAKEDQQTGELELA